MPPGLGPVREDIEASQPRQNGFHGVGISFRRDEPSTSIVALFKTARPFSPPTPGGGVVDHVDLGILVTLSLRDASPPRDDLWVDEDGT